MERWTQEQALAYQAARDAITDVIAGYSAQLYAERQSANPNQDHIAWLDLRMTQAHDVRASLRLLDGASVRQTAAEFNAIFHANKPLQDALAPR